MLWDRRVVCIQEAEARGEDYDRIKHMNLTSLDAEKIVEKERKKAKQADRGFTGMRAATCLYWAGSYSASISLSSIGRYVTPPPGFCRGRNSLQCREPEPSVLCRALSGVLSVVFPASGAEHDCEAAMDSSCFRDASPPQRVY